MTQFHPLLVDEVRPETAEAVSLRFKVPPALAATFRFEPGQFLTLRRSFDGADVRRCYSICASPDDGELRVAIKKVASGLFSTWANEGLEAGTKIDVMPPDGRFVPTIDPEREKSTLLVAAGSGITPILSIARTVLAREPQSRLTLLYGNRRTSSIMFAGALDDLKDCYLDRLAIIHVLSREQQESELASGRIDARKIALLARGALDVTRLDAAFLCGPEAMTRDVGAALLSHGLDKTRIHVELFETEAGRAAARAPRPAQTTAPEVPPIAIVEAILDGRRISFPFHAADRGVVDAAARAGLDLPYSCKGGMCCTCRAKVVEGAASMALNYSLEPWEQEAGFVLSCQARPTTPRLVLDYDQA